MNGSSRVYIAAVGMITPIGADPVMTFHSVNTGVGRVRETAVLNRTLDPLGLALVPDEALPDLDPRLARAPIPHRQLRLLRLAAAALAQLADRLPPGPVPLFLALPEDLPGMSAPLVGDIIDQLAAQTGIRLNRAESLIATIGRAGGVHTVRKAHQYLGQPGHDYVLIGGVDTYWDPYLLAKLDADTRLNPRRNPDGFHPGEGAAFLLLASERLKTRLPAPCVALALPGAAEEPGHRYSDEPYRGEGMALAVARAFKHAGTAQTQCVWTSMIYDSLGHKEIGVALIRRSDQIAEDVDIRHPADCFGDLGAAIGCTLIGMIAAAVPWQPRLRHHLVCCASDREHRAAVRVDIE